MKRILFRDLEANRATYELLIPESMKSWQIADFLEFMKKTPAEADSAGFLAKAPDPFYHQSFRLLVNQPDSTLNEPVAFLQEGNRLIKGDFINTSNAVNIVELGRISQREVKFDQVDIARRNLQDYKDLQVYLNPILNKAVKLDQTCIKTIYGKKVESFNELTENFLTDYSTETQLHIIYRTVQKVWEAPFENISRLTGLSQFRSGVQMWSSIANGTGGICAEKTAAVKFVLDILKIPNHPVFASRHQIPDDIESQLLQFIHSKGSRKLNSWLEHHAIRFKVGGKWFFIDATNGNHPLLFLDENDFAKRLKGGIKARMVYHSEKYRLKESTNLAGDLLLTLTEFHKADLYYEYIFKQGLGLQINSLAFITVFFDWGGKPSALMEQYYSKQAYRRKLPFPYFLHEGNFDAEPDENLRALLMSLRKELHLRYKHPFYTGDFTFVIQPLTSNFWLKPQISNSVRIMLELQ